MARSVIEGGGRAELAAGLVRDGEVAEGAALTRGAARPLGRAQGPLQEGSHRRSQRTDRRAHAASPADRRRQAAGQRGPTSRQPTRSRCRSPTRSSTSTRSAGRHARGPAPAHHPRRRPARHDRRGADAVTAAGFIPPGSTSRPSAWSARCSASAARATARSCSSPSAASRTSRSPHRGVCAFTRVAGGGLERLAIELAERRELTDTAGPHRGSIACRSRGRARRDRRATPRPPPTRARSSTTGVRRHRQRDRTSLDFQQGRAEDGVAVERVVLTGPAVAVAGLRAALEAELGLDVEARVVGAPSRLALEPARRRPPQRRRRPRRRDRPRLMKAVNLIPADCHAAIARVALADGHGRLRRLRGARPACRDGRRLGDEPTAS